MSVLGLVGDVGGDRANHLLWHQRTVFHVVHHLRGLVVVDADLVEINILAGFRIRAQAFEDLHHDVGGGAAQFQCSTRVKCGLGQIVILDDQMLGRHEARITVRTLAKDVGLPCVECHFEQVLVVAEYPECALILVGYFVKGCPIGGAADLITNSFDHILAGAIT